MKNMNCHFLYHIYLYSFILLSLSSCFYSLSSESVVNTDTTTKTEAEIKTTETTASPEETNETTTTKLPTDSTFPPGWDRIAPVVDEAHPPINLTLGDDFAEVKNCFEVAVFLFNSARNSGELLIWDLPFDIMIPSIELEFPEGTISTTMYNPAMYTEQPILYYYTTSNLDWVYGKEVPSGTFTLQGTADAIYIDDTGKSAECAHDWWSGWTYQVSRPFNYKLSSEPDAVYIPVERQFVPREALIVGERCIYVGFRDPTSGYLTMAGGSESQMNDRFRRLITKAEEMRDLTFGAAPD